MHVLIIGAAGMVGKKLTNSILSSCRLGSKKVTVLELVDVIEPTKPDADEIKIHTHELDLSDQQATSALINQKPDVIIHLAAIVSGEAEKDFEKGYRINLDGTRYLFDAVRNLHESSGYYPKILFSSSIAVYGTPFPDAIDDAFLSAPLSSYGTQKAMSELLLNDYTRKGYCDGLSMRLPTVCVRPGKANAAASSFFSNIIREPLAGKTANLPVSRTVRHWHISPRRVVGFFHHAVDLDLSDIGPRRALNMPGLSVTVQEQIDALVRVAGPKVAELISEVPDPVIQSIVSTWPETFDPRRSIALGFTADASFDEIIQVHIEDELS